MPGAMMQGDILNRLAIPPDQQMAGDAKCGNFGKIGVLFAPEPIEKQVVDPGAAKLAGRQADVVDHQQIDLTTRGTFVLIG